MRQYKFQKKPLFSSQLKALMESKGLTQQQVAKQAEVSQNAVYKWLHGSIPGPGKLNSIAIANGVSMQWFLEVPESGPSSKSEHEVMLDINPASRQDAGVKEIRSLSELLDQVRKLTKPRGRKVELANVIGVTRQAVDQWLSGTAKPSAETTFALLNWVRKQNG